jgi:hypothetical protein
MLTMKRLLHLLLFLAALALGGCGLNRSDVVCGPDGKANREEMSDTGTSISRAVQNGPRLRFDF